MGDRRSELLILDFGLIPRQERGQGREGREGREGRSEEEEEEETGVVLLCTL